MQNAALANSPSLSPSQASADFLAIHRSKCLLTSLQSIGRNACAASLIDSQRLLVIGGSDGGSDLACVPDSSSAIGDVQAVRFRNLQSLLCRSCSHCMLLLLLSATPCDSLNPSAAAFLVVATVEAAATSTLTSTVSA